MGKLTQYFTVEETVYSESAERLGISNVPSVEIQGILLECAHKMDIVRQILGFPVHVSSWYRSQALNEKLGGHPNSRHTYGEAVDFICPIYGPPLAVVRTLERNVDKLDYDQLIFEYSWVHISFALNPPRKARREVLTLLPDKSYARGIVVISKA